MTGSVGTDGDGVSPRRRRPSPKPRPTPFASDIPRVELNKSVTSEPAAHEVPEVPTSEDSGPPPPWWRRFLGSGDKGKSGKGAKKSLAREIPVLVLIALVLALLIKSFVVQPFYIPSGSMERTLLVNDRVLVNKMIYHFRDPKRGEIVVFNIEGTGFARYATALKPPGNIASRAFRNIENLFGLGPNNKDFIKRVIAIGGDTVACCNAKGQVTINGKGLDEPYVYRDGPDEPNKRFGPVKISKGDVWVMGDHRNNSEDSRVGGQVPKSKVVGQAFVRVWPLSDWRGFGVPKTFSALNASASPAVGLFLMMGWRRRRSKGASKKLPLFPVLDAYRRPPAD
jgi:signal peptidase I